VIRVLGFFADRRGKRHQALYAAKAAGRNLVETWNLSRVKPSRAGRMLVVG
jgi:hypothetical protein